MASPGEFTAGDVLAAADMNDLPAGWLGYAEVTASQTGISSETDLTGLSVTVEVPASRRIRVTGVGEIRQNTSQGLASGFIKESTTDLNYWHRATVSTNARSHGGGSVVLTPSSGSHTYKLALATTAGTVDLIAASTSPAYILVEDIGPA